MNSSEGHEAQRDDSAQRDHSAQGDDSDPEQEPPAHGDAEDVTNTVSHDTYVILVSRI